MLRFVLIRHGQTEWNLERRIQGCLNSDLTKDAISKLKQIELPTLRYPVMYTSDLGRACESARIIASLIGVDFTQDFRLRERKFGVLEGKVINQEHQLREQWQAYHQRYTKKVGNAFDFESEAEFEQRICSFLSELDKHPSHSDVVIVSHGEWIRAFINIVEGIPSWHGGRGIEDNGSPVIIDMLVEIN
ncbi:histidine phosphatase family protein [Vibrio sp. F74]|uniref:histidine phosphatase family protein n=1 Tax=Vibrio sp. F74 TaxID=700020 RepID=UPI0035F5D935